MGEPAYRMRTVEDFDGTTKRVRVATVGGDDGYWISWTGSCSGCTELGECGSNPNGHPYDAKAQCHVGFGCHECGYKGKRRQHWFVKFDEASAPESALLAPESEVG